MKKILIVEDNPDNAELARKALTARGYDVYQADTAESGLKTALAALPDLILLDLGLPDHDGLTLVGWIREKPKTQKIRIVAYTAWPEDTAKKMAESYGCDGFVSKPIENIRVFADYIESIVGKN